MCVCYSEDHIEQMKKTAGMKPRELHRLASDYNSVFLNQQSYSAALLAAGAACNAARSILTGEVYTLLHYTTTTTLYCPRLH